MSVLAALWSARNEYNMNSHCNFHICDVCHIHVLNKWSKVLTKKHFQTDLPSEIRTIIFDSESRLAKPYGK